MHDDQYNGLKEEVREGTEILLERGWSAPKALEEALEREEIYVEPDKRKKKKRRKKKPVEPTPPPPEPPEPPPPSFQQ